MMGASALASILGLCNGLVLCHSYRASAVAFLRPLTATSAVLSKSLNHRDATLSLRSWSSRSSRARAVAPKSSESDSDAVHTSLPFPVNRYIDEFLSGASLALLFNWGRNPFPEYTRLLPCPLDNTFPRIEHLVVSEGGPALEYICRALDLPPLFVADLIQFGAVHSALVCPKPPPTATPEQMRIYKKVTDPSVLKSRTSIKGKTIRDAQNTFRITHPEQFLEEGSYLRVSVHPKRFPRCYEVDWKSRVIAVTESYVVLDKPAGISVGGTTDNIEESCATFTARALGFEEPLRTTHQIDNCSEGCVVLARTKEYCSVFHGKIRDKRVKKLYKALTAAPVPVGVITHYMRPVRRSPRIFSPDYVNGWHLCQLEVLDCKEVPWPDSILEAEYSLENCIWPRKDVAYECTINLLTGRTHQIRAQLSSLGAPIVGDSMYMAAAVAEMVNPGINPLRKSKKGWSETNMEEWVAQHGKEPSVAIGLQACQISWDEEEFIYNAGMPWWRAGQKSSGLSISYSS